MVEAIAESGTRTNGFVQLALALPVSERARKQALLERATLELKSFPQPLMKVRLSMQVMRGYLDLGIVENARLLAQGGQKILDALPPETAKMFVPFQAQVARIAPVSVLERIQKMDDPDVRAGYYYQVALQLAIEHPAEAERAFNLCVDRIGFNRNFLAMRICRRLATTDLTRAERIAAALETPGARACAWAFTALGVSDHDKQAAHQALERSIEAIDRIRESGPGLELVTSTSGFLYPTNPAVVILPIIEQVVPERLAEFFWRGALHDRIELEQEDGLLRSPIGFETMLLSHYDRGVAAALFEPMELCIRSVIAQKGRSDELTARILVAKACIDPKAGVELLDALPVARERSPADAVDEARISLAKAFSVPAPERWKRLWRTMSAASARRRIDSRSAPVFVNLVGMT